MTTHQSKPKRRCNKCGLIGTNYYILKGRPDSYCKQCRSAINVKSHLRQNKKDVFVDIERASTEIDFWRILVNQDQRTWDKLIDHFLRTHEHLTISYVPEEQWLRHPNVKRQHLPLELLAGEKFCITCKELKPLAEFYSEPHNLDNLTRKCKACIILTYSDSPDQLSLQEKDFLHSLAINTNPPTESYSSSETNAISSETVNCIYCKRTTEDIIQLGKRYKYCRRCRNIRQKVENKKYTKTQSGRQILTLYSEQSNYIPEPFYAILFHRYFVSTHDQIAFQQLITFKPELQIIEFNPPSAPDETHFALYERFTNENRPKHELITNHKYILNLYNLIKT